MILVNYCLKFFFAKYTEVERVVSSVQLVLKSFFTRLFYHMTKCF